MAITDLLINEINTKQAPYIGPLHVEPEAYPDADHVDYSKKYWAKADDTAPADEYCFNANSAAWTEVPRLLSDGFESPNGTMAYFDCGKEVFRVNVPDTAFGLGLISTGAVSYPQPNGDMWVIEQSYADLSFPRSYPVFFIEHITRAGVLTSHRFDLTPDLLPTVGPQGETIDSDPQSPYRPDFDPYLEYEVQQLFPQQNGVGVIIRTHYKTPDPQGDSRRPCLYFRFEKSGSSVVIAGMAWVAVWDSTAFVPIYRNPIVTPSMQLLQEGFAGVNMIRRLNTEGGFLDRWRYENGNFVYLRNLNTSRGLPEDGESVINGYKMDDENGNIYVMYRDRTNAQEVTHSGVLKMSVASLEPTNLSWATNLVRSGIGGEVSRMLVSNDGERILFARDIVETQDNIFVDRDYLVYDNNGNKLLEVIATTPVGSDDLLEQKESSFSYHFFGRPEGQGVNRAGGKDFMFPRTIFNDTDPGPTISREARKYTADSIVSGPSICDVNTTSKYGGDYYPRYQYPRFDYSAWT